jgi:hypothetical protein
MAGDSNRLTQSTRTRWLNSLTQVFELDARLDSKNFQYRLELGYAEATKEQKVALERLTVDGATVFVLAEGKIRFFPNTSASVAVPLQTTRSALPLSVLSNDEVRHFVEWLSNHVHCFDIDPYPGQMDEVADSEERAPDFELNNLAGWYRSLVTTNPHQNVKFLESLKRCMDGFLTLRFSSEEDGVRKLRAEFASPSGKRVSYSISELSEGQRCLVSLYMILHFPIEQGDTVFVDEPDQLHRPARNSALAALRRMSCRRAPQPTDPCLSPPGNTESLGSALWTPILQRAERPGSRRKVLLR